MLYYKNYSKLNLHYHKINRNTNLQLFIKIEITAGLIRQLTTDVYFFRV